MHNEDFYSTYNLPRTYYQGDEEEDEDETGGVYRRNGKETHMRVHFVRVRGKEHLETVDTIV